MNILPSQEILLQACQSMPVFPLPRVVLFPGTLLRLHVFEPRYVQLVEHVQAEDGLFAIPMLQMNRLKVSNPKLYPVAGVGKVIHCTDLPDNRYNIVILGAGRIRFETELGSDHLYRVMQGELLSEDSHNFDVQPLQLLLSQIMMRKPALTKTLTMLLDEALPVRTFLNTVAQLILSSADERQMFLEIEGAMEQGDFLSEKLAEVLLADFT